MESTLPYFASRTADRRWNNRNEKANPFLHKPSPAKELGYRCCHIEPCHHQRQLDQAAMHEQKNDEGSSGSHAADGGYDGGENISLQTGEGGKKSTERQREGSG